MEKQILSSGDINRLTKMIGNLEGQAFGEWFRFSIFGNYVSNLHFDMNRGWTEVDGFRFEGDEEYKLARKFCDDMNAATSSIRQKFADDLRQLLANECTRLGAESLNKPTTPEVRG